MSNESKIHIKNIKFLMTEIYSFLNDRALLIMNNIFQKQGNYYCLKEKFTTTYGMAWCKSGTRTPGPKSQGPEVLVPLLHHSIGRRY